MNAKTILFHYEKVNQEHICLLNIFFFRGVKYNYQTNNYFYGFARHIKWCNKALYILPF